MDEYRNVLVLTNGRNLEDIATGSAEQVTAPAPAGPPASKPVGPPPPIDFTNLTSWNNPDDVPQVAEDASPLRNTSILQHTTILQQQKYQLLLDREQMLIQMNRQRNRMEQYRIHQQICDSDKV